MKKRNYQLTKHFSLQEMIVTKQPFNNFPQSLDIFVNLMKLCHVLEHYRRVVGPLYVNSAYRSKEVNIAVKGHPKSYHLRGLAADVRSKKYSPLALKSFFRANPHPLYKVDVVDYPTFVHVEITNG